MAVFCLALPASFVLMGTFVVVSSTIQHMRWRMVAAHDVLNCLAIAFLLACASWSAGLAVTSISRKTLWLSGISCLLPCVFCFCRFRIESLPRLSLFLFLFPAALGAWQSIRTMRIRRGFAAALAIALTMWIALTWTRGLSLNAVLLWPSWYILATAYRKAATNEGTA